MSMSTLPDTAAATVAAHAMLEPGAPLLAMVSGGADSVALLRWLAGGGADGSPLSVLHLTHLLRGDAADGDAAFVEALCGALGVPCRVVRPLPSGVPCGRGHCCLTQTAQSLLALHPQGARGWMSTEWHSRLSRLS